VRLPSALLVATLGMAGLVAVSSAAAAPPAVAQTTGGAAGTYVPVPAFRAVDTRTGAGGNRRGSLAHGHGFTARVGGMHGVPTDVSAVALTVTALAPSGAGGLVVYRAGGTRPSVQNVRFAAGATTSAAALVRTSSAGKVTVYNAAHKGRTQVTIDVAGYYVGGHPSDEVPGVLHTLPPSKAFGSHRIGAHRALTADLGGRAGVPSASVGAVAVVLTATAPAKPGALVAYQAGAGHPLASITSFGKGADAAGFGLVPTDGDGRIAVYNTSAGPVHVSIGVVGYTVGGVVTDAGATQVGAAKRIVPRTTLGSAHTTTVSVVGHGGVPNGRVTAVLVNLTATGKRAGSLTTWTAGRPRPRAVNLQFPAGRTASALALVRPSSKGKIEIRNASASATDLAVDVVGYVAAVNAPPVGKPTTSNSHYIRAAYSANDLYNRGCTDAMNGSRLVLLDLGAQTVTSPLSSAHPGVLLTTTQTRLDYPTLRTSIDGYLNGFHSCPDPPDLKATIAVGTNNDGAFAGDNAYSAAKRGADWAEFIATLRTDAATIAPEVTVVGANDIESSFSGTLAQTETWVRAYLAADNTSDRVGPLINNGSADGCPSALGVTDRSCANDWTQSDYYALAHGLGASRIQLLPQVYNSAQPKQWANIDATGGGAIRFAGSLTEHAACPTASSPGCKSSSVPALHGWQALYNAVATVVDHPKIPAATDLDVDGQPAS
jgi:hypothetical protein